MQLRDKLQNVSIQVLIVSLSAIFLGIAILSFFSFTLGIHDGNYVNVSRNVIDSISTVAGYIFALAYAICGAVVHWVTRKITERRLRFIVNSMVTMLFLGTISRFAVLMSGASDINQLVQFFFRMTSTISVFIFAFILVKFLPSLIEDYSANRGSLQEPDSLNTTLKAAARIQQSSETIERHLSEMAGRGESL